MQKGAERPFDVGMKAQSAIVFTVLLARLAHYAQRTKKR